MRITRLTSLNRRGLDTASFLALYDNRAEALLRFFARRTLDPQAAADLMAETFVQAFASRDRFDPERGDLAGWLFGIARHELDSYLRTSQVERAACRRLDVPERSLSAADYERVEALIDFADIGRQVQEALGNLVPEQRQAVVFRVVDGLAYSEVAKRLGCSEDSARARVSRGLRTLATAIATSAVETSGGSGT